MEMIRDIYRTRFWLSVIVTFTGGILLLYLAELIGEGIWQGVVENLGTAFFFTGIFGLVQEYILKDKLVDVILSKLNLKKDIDRTGIESIFFGISDIDYGFFLKKAVKNIDIVHVYGRTWTNSNVDEIKDRLIRSNCKIRIVLLDPNSLFIPALAAHYNQAPEELKQSIKYVSNTWKEAYLEKEQVKRRKTQSSIDLYYHTGFPANSLYRIDERLIFVQNKMTKGKSKKLPSFIYSKLDKGDSLYNDNLLEIEALINEAVKVDWSQL
ncbi:hypothetical protein [Paenibacillus sp. B-A-8]|uniref:hypothetical protein n=1 Tax=Paenibacillus sp. B-A-8 TaxID=3400419 RepID=UPI003B0282F5